MTFPLSTASRLLCGLTGAVALLAGFSLLEHPDWLGLVTLLGFAGLGAAAFGHRPRPSPGPRPPVRPHPL